MAYNFEKRLQRHPKKNCGIRNYPPEKLPDPGYPLLHTWGVTLKALKDASKALTDLSKRATKEQTK